MTWNKHSTTAPSSLLSSPSSLPHASSSLLDMPLLIITVILAMVGLIMVYSVTLNSNFIFLKGQIIRIGFGFAALVIAVNVPYRIYQGWVKYLLLFGVIALLILTLILGRQVAAAKRWTGFFQPAEIAKFILIIYLAGYFANKKENGENINSWRCLVLPLIATGVISLLLILQPAVGTTIILFVSALLIFFVAGVKFRNLLIIILAGLTLLGVRISQIKYAQDRVKRFSAGTTYQQKQSRIAIGSGGVTGQGLGEGKQKFYFLPKLHTDFIFSAIGEEFGLIGCVIILIAFYLLFNRGLKIGAEINDHFGQLLVFGIIVVIFQYVLVHLAVALAIIPCTGQPLPFVSFGGSALVTNLYAIGIILNISKFRRKNNGINTNYHRWNRRTYLARSRYW
jgi:cell division protein FtsW